MAHQSESFGAALRRYREAAGLSQEELAERAELSANAISALERGFRRNPYPTTVRRLTRALALSDDDLALLMASRSGGRSSASVPQAAGPGAPSSSSPPHYREPLIGREREVSEMLQLLGSSAVCLVTLTGPGGVGKTRLASSVVQRASGMFDDGVAWVSLASIGDPTLVVPTVVQVLGLRESGAQTPSDVLRLSLRDKRMLLVLDNFEHVLDAAGDVAELLLACRDLSVLVTSRAPLRLRDEQEYPVPPLVLPALAHVPRLSEVQQNPAVALFVRRARQASPSFELTSANALSIAAICRRLDGLPLAIELAAARVKLLTPSEVLQRLHDSLPLLTGGVRDLPERQRTMRGAIAWSYDLLDPTERALFQRLSVFAGGWTLEAAEAVGTSGSLEPVRVLEVLGGLVDQSLVLVDRFPDDSHRYRMLEPVRQYAAESLGGTGDAEDAQRRHARYYLAFAAGAELGLGRVESVARLDVLQAEQDNLRVALHWLAAQEDPQDLVHMAACLGWFWLMRGHWSEGRNWLTQALRRAKSGAGRVPGAGLPGSVGIRPRATALYYAAELAYAQGDLTDARRLFEESVSMWRDVGDPRGLAHVLHRLGEILWSFGEDDAVRAANEEAEALFTEAGDRAGLGNALRGQGKATILIGDIPLARSLLEQSLVLSRDSSDDWGVANALLDLSRVALLESDPARVQASAEASLARFESIGDTKGVIVSLHHLGLAASMAGEHGRARALHQRVLALCADVGDSRYLPRSLASLARADWAQGQAERAAQLLGAADLLMSEMIPPPRSPERSSHDDLVASVRAGLGEERFGAAWARGRAMAADEALAYALPGDASRATD